MNDSPINPTPTIQPRGSGLVERVKAILLKPSPTWDVIATEPASVKSLYMGYILPLAAIGPIAGLLGILIFTGLLAILAGPFLVIGAIFGFVMNLVVVYVMALIVDGLAPSFGGQRNFLQAFKVMAYSMTAAWVAAVIGLIPFLGWLSILGGLYSLYLLYLGLPKLMGAPAEKSLGYTAVVVVIAIALSLVVSAITRSVMALGTLGAVATYSAAANKTVTVPGMGSVDLAKVEQAANQMAAEASAQAAGGTTVTLADPQGLLALMPANYLGAARADDSTQSGGAAGVSVATASANYVINGNAVELEVTDLGSVSGLGALATAVNVNTSSSSAGGYEKVTTSNGQMVAESWNSETKQGSYTIVRNGRISVEASGTVDSIEVLKNLVNGLDAGRLEALSKT
ncbi:hypothetical protein ABI_08360 [Asticcacaulis biprosthecium C19]|uniref:Yip1 domain-containing protein n=1 Tax=Asticcacaulis biprosthecium C19 TaxID=715226 RepID=F4QG72_9CAUL|nr:Yip1 family protein [Asticcacaulis biprosthecium]EGF92400.1 hypothetical protein ABI_08360 [Asticcacaulis biprosthecium C19]